MLPHTHFTSDWFTQYADLWLARMGHLSSTKVLMLEIGSYEGRSACWLLSNILQHHESQLTCVDTWDGKDKVLGGLTERAFNTFLKNTAPYRPAKVGYVVGSSYLYLAHLLTRNMIRLFDIVFVDGDHEGYSALSDLVMSWPLLKKGGHLVFDDYQWESDKLRSQPKQAWDGFAATKPEGLEWELDGRLIFARKL